jgi:hypothetical protein
MTCLKFANLYREHKTSDTLATQHFQKLDLLRIFIDRVPRGANLFITAPSLWRVVWCNVFCATTQDSLHLRAPLFSLDAKKRSTKNQVCSWYDVKTYLPQCLPYLFILYLSLSFQHLALYLSKKHKIQEWNTPQCNQKNSIVITKLKSWFGMESLNGSMLQVDNCWYTGIWLSFLILYRYSIWILSDR